MVAGGSDISRRRAWALPRSHYKHQIGRRYALPLPLTIAKDSQARAVPEPVKVTPYPQDRVESAIHCLGAVTTVTLVAFGMREARAGLGRTH